jgi:hypothetical protein
VIKVPTAWDKLARPRPSGRSVRIGHEYDAAETRPEVEDWPDGGCARAASHPLGYGQVGAAHQRSVCVGQSIERAVAETDYSLFVGHRLGPARLQRGS